MKTIKKLTDLTYGDNAYHYGRMLYKYTDCGPWIAYVIKDTDAKTLFPSVVIGMGKDGPEIAKPFDDQGDFILHLGFEEDGSTEAWKGWTLEKLAKEIEKFEKKERKEYSRRDYKNLKVERMADHIIVSGRKDVEATYKTVYYGDATEENVTDENCIGVDIGSIVEGSDVEVGPERLMFPFTEKQLDDTVKAINDEASFYWERDNSKMFEISYRGKSKYYLQETWGDFKWEGGKPSKTATCKAIEEIASNADFKDYETHNPVPDHKGWTVREFLNDITY